MKRKIYGLILLLTLVFCVGCNKNKKDNPAEPPAATATETPTPTPANLAKINLDKLPELYDKLMSYQPQNSTDFSKGVGYDVTLKVSLGEQIASLLELSDLESISATGTIDAKDTMAANFDLCLNDDKILNAHLFADSTNLLFNLPAYSENYAAISWEELLSSVTEDAYSLTGSNVISTINTVDNKPFPSDAEMNALLRKYLKEFTECFTAVDGTTSNVSIGTGDYLLAGKKYTVRANINDIYAIMESLEAELKKYSEDFTFGLEELKIDGATALLLDYYISENGDYAWTAYSDSTPEEQVVFINTALGVCVYGINTDGSTEILLYSEKTTESSGTITFPSSEEDGEDIGTIDYEYSDTSFTMQAMIDDVVFTVEASKVNDTIRYDITVIAEGVSFVITETVTPTLIEMSCSLASFGMEYLTLSMSAKSRDYEEIPVPVNTVDPDTWTNELDQTALLSDIMELLQKYPTLMSLFFSSGDGPAQDDTFGDESSTKSPVEVPKDYTDDFKSMTGYAVVDGNVDFFPLEKEVLALGHPSTGMDTMEISEDNKNALLEYAKKSVPNCKPTTETFYWIWGSVEFQDVQSYYSKDYVFTDSKNYNNSISIAFDAVSGEFASVDIYNEDKDTAIAIANDVLGLLGIEYTVDAEFVENYNFARNLSFSGYDGSEYGGDYYNVSFSVYYPEW